MDEQGRPRKTIRQAGKSAERRGSAASAGAARGTLKGKPIEDEPRALPAKMSIAAAKRAAAGSERAVSPRRELPLPMENLGAARDQSSSRSLRLRLLVEGERITVLDAVEVDVPAPGPQRVRGTNFVEVRAGDDVLTVQPLVDPGVEIGIPDPNDTTEFRGHREVQVPSYEVAVRVPLDAMEALVARAGEQRDQSALEVTIYRASETLEVDPGRFNVAREGRGRLTRVATTGRLRLDEVGAQSRYADRKPEPGSGARPDRT